MLVLFCTIQNMKMHLRAAFRVLSSFCTSDDLPIQGAVKSNGEGPALWLIITISLIRYLYQQQVVTNIISPVSKLSQCLAALLYADDADLYVFNDAQFKTEEVLIKG